MQMENYRQAARNKFPFGRITGAGRHACVRKCKRGFGTRWKISLHETAELADRAPNRECRTDCGGVWNHFTTTVAPLPVVLPEPKPEPLRLFSSLHE
jgi:hypothetical protein